jgi:phage FluMu protein Com
MSEPVDGRRLRISDHWPFIWLAGAEGDERRKSQCPRCKSARGNAFMNSATSSATTLSYRCPECRHEWKVTRASQPLSTPLPPA